ncbi:WhiB family transcriptional regulator [Streptomyces sp. DT224]|uniref:WhiB family transcriptional regulator n=1 Tax=Streptomyces sp. DT224 TaxID=3393426 RepID=UPI003CEC7D9C
MKTPFKPQRTPQGRPQGKPQTKPLLRLWAWQADAACRGVDSSVFYSPTGERVQARRRREEAARAICQRCPVIDPCRLFAMTTDQRFGVWGGRTEAERRSTTTPSSSARRAAAHVDSWADS